MYEFDSKKKRWGVWIINIAFAYGVRNKEVGQLSLWLRAISVVIVMFNHQLLYGYTSLHNHLVKTAFPYFYVFFLVNLFVYFVNYHHCYFYVLSNYVPSVKKKKVIMHQLPRSSKLNVPILNLGIIPKWKDIVCPCSR